VPTLALPKWFFEVYVLFLCLPLVAATASRCKEFFGQTFPICSNVNFTQVINTRVKILKNYSRFKNEGNIYSRSTLRRGCCLWGCFVIKATNVLALGAVADLAALPVPIYLENCQPALNPA